ncbi:hypothetical protein NQ318_018820, partial [Aromia moschata]
TSSKGDPVDENTVLITSSSSIKYFQIPTSDDPILTWMEVRKGKFPNVTNDTSGMKNVTVGEPVTLLVFFKDPTGLYNIRIPDCWAFERTNILLSKYKLHLNGEKKRKKILSEWRKGTVGDEEKFLYATFASFKFPDKDQVFVACDVEVRIE